MVESTVVSTVLGWNQDSTKTLLSATRRTSLLTVRCHKCGSSEWVVWSGCTRTSTFHHITVDLLGSIIFSTSLVALRSVLSPVGIHSLYRGTLGWTSNPELLCATTNGGIPNPVSRSISGHQSKHNCRSITDLFQFGIQQAHVRVPPFW